jgi:hypothetical protein
VGINDDTHDFDVPYVPFSGQQTVSHCQRLSIQFEYQLNSPICGVHLQSWGIEATKTWAAYL